MRYRRLILGKKVEKNCCTWKGGFYLLHFPVDIYPSCKVVESVSVFVAPALRNFFPRYKS